MKGISPLIASVILIAFTTAIAGIMATWATTFVREKTTGISTETKCIGALDITTLSFSNGNVSFTVKNTNTQISLTTLKASIIYADPLKNREYILSDYSVSDPMPPASIDWAIINTSDSEKPLSVEAISMNCPDYPAALHFS
ncbi:MAG: hypothetical protein J4473_02895 [Candidatus Aenigmarchaeota archaeon]|nr:hypothetical protein [Candidatus Aenigmarchaeota archaeon]